MLDIDKTTTSLEKIAKLNGRTVAAFAILAIVGSVLFGFVDIALLDGKVGIALAALVATATFLLIGVNMQNNASELSRQIGDLAARLSVCESARDLLEVQNRLLTESNDMLRQELDILKKHLNK